MKIKTQIFEVFYCQKIMERKIQMKYKQKTNKQLSK